MIFFLFGQAVLLWSDVLTLKRWRDAEWPLEKQIILINQAQVEARLAVVEMQLRELR